MRTSTEQDKSTNSRIRRAALRVAVATATSTTVLVVAAEVAHARIALNHNEAAGRDDADR